LEPEEFEVLVRGPEKADDEAGRSHRPQAAAALRAPVVGLLGRRQEVLPHASGASLCSASILLLPSAGCAQIVAHRRKVHPEEESGHILDRRDTRRRIHDSFHC